MVMLPPTRVCNPAPIVPKIERERTMMPRTTPNVFRIRYPSSSNAVVVMAAFMRPIYKRSARLHAFQLRFLRRFRGRLLGFELVELALYEGQILHVEEGDIDHVANDQDGTARLDDLEQAHVYRSPADRFDEREHDMAAIEHWNWQHVQNGKVHIQDHAKPQSQLPASLILKQHVINASDPDRSAEVLQFYVRFRRRNRPDCIQSSRLAIINLLNRIGMRQRKASR